LVDGLAATLKAHVRLGHRVECVERSQHGYRVFAKANGVSLVPEEFDFVVIALPHPVLSQLRFGGTRLRRAMAAHIAHYDHDAHYLRVSVHFSRPFWRDVMSDHYWMHDVFGGTCVYDEGARYGDTGTGAVLGWLIAGVPALELANWSDEALIAEVLSTLPEPLRAGRGLAVQGRVHRWMGAVSAQPGGFPTRDEDERHVPEPHEHPGLFLVGDYLYDSTLNGVHDSADTVSELILEELEEHRETAPALKVANAKAY
jgi:monoamine oxidase